MNNKLFIVCPFSSMECFLRKQYGNQALFLTSMTAQSQFHAVKYVEAIKEIIVQEAISRLYIVNDLSCRFINGILKGEQSFGTMAEIALQNILIDNYALITNQSTFIDKVQCLAELNVKHQLESIADNELFKQLITQYNLELAGLITNKHRHTIQELKLHTSEF